MTATTGSQLLYGKDYGGSAPENYERYFVPVIPGPLATELVAAAALRPGERVLDVACGTGIVARLAAERVGTAGAVAGVDVNPGMLAVARSTAAHSGAPIRWYETSAESLPLADDSFDVVFCQLGLMFFTDRGAALREMRRVLASGGRLLASVPRPSAFFRVFEDALARHIDAATSQFVAQVFSLNDPRELERLVADAGFREVAVHTSTKTPRLPPPADFLWQYVYLTPLSAVLSQVEEERRAALERDVVAGWQRWARDGGMEYPQEMLVVTAWK
jgi:ubiquinone/menaquinone biosynthesis C-methylase UbiE